MMASFEKKPAKPRSGRKRPSAPKEKPTPVSASVPMIIISQVIGIMRNSPPILRMSCSSWTPWITAPEPRNKSALKKACVNRWNMAAP